MVDSKEFVWAVTDFEWAITASVWATLHSLFGISHPLCGQGRLGKTVAESDYFFILFFITRSNTKYKFSTRRNTELPRKSISIIYVDSRVYTFSSNEYQLIDESKSVVFDHYFRFQ